MLQNWKLDFRIIKPLLKLGYPVVAGNIGLVIMLLVDNAMVGSLGHVELAASGISNTIFFVTSVFGVGVLVVYSASIATYLKSLRSDTEALISATLFVGILVAVVTFILMKIFYLNFHWFQQPLLVADEAMPYFDVITYGIFPMFIYLSFKNISDGHSKTLPAMFATLSALLLNVFLNWIFIYGNLGSPKYGLVGAGYATLISRIYMAIYMVAYIFYSGNINYHWHSLRLKITRKQVIDLLRLGIPSGLQFFYEVTAFAAAAVFSGWLGARYLAAHQVAIGLVSLTYMISNGISVAAMIKVGEALSKRGKQNLRRIGSNAIAFSAYLMLFFAIILILFSKPLVSIFTYDLEVIKIATQLLYIAAIFQLFDGIQVVSMGILRGMGDTSIPSKIAFFSYWVLALPLCYFLGLHTFTGINGIWLGLTIGLICAAVLLYRRFIKQTS